MSESAIRWVRARCIDPEAPRLTEGERLLLLWLASYHSEIEDAWPTVAVLANLMGVSERRIQQLLTQLEGDGCLTRDSRGGRGHASSYTLCIPVKGETLDAIKGEMGEAQSTPFAVIKGEEIKGERVKSEDVKGEAIVSPLGEPKGGGVTELRSTSSPPLFSKATETIMRENTPESEKVRTPKTRPKRDVKPTSPLPPDLQAVCDRWTALGLGHLSAKAVTGLRLLVAEHGRAWVELGLEKAAAGQVQWPVSWLKACIPGWKKEGQQTNGKTQPATTGPPRGRLSEADAARAAEYQKRGWG